MERESYFLLSDILRKKKFFIFFVFVCFESSALKADVASSILPSLDVLSIEDE